MRRPRRLKFATLLATLALVVACSSTQRAAGGKEADEAESRYGRLELLNVTTTPSPDALTFRGTFRNQFDQPIEDVRIVLRIYQEPNESAPELARTQKLLDTRLEPGEHVPFEVKARVAPSSLANAGLFLSGFAVLRGGEQLPITPLWKAE